MTNQPLIRTALAAVINNAIAASEVSPSGTNILSYSDPEIQGVAAKTLNYASMFSMKPSPDRKHVVWTINEMGAGSMKSLSSLSVTVEQKNFCKTKHDLVAEFFTGTIGTDSKWTMIDPESKEHGTPDYISQVGENSWLILEVGTCVGTGAPALAMYRNKYSKYLPTIERLAEKFPNQRFIYWIVIVGPNEIVTTFKMNFRAVEELSTRYYVGVAMESALVKAGLMERFDSESETSTERIVRQSIRNLSRTPMNGAEQTVGDGSYDNFKNTPIDREYLTESMKFMLEEAKSLRITRQQALDDMRAAYQALETEINRPDKTRSDLKSPIQIPLILANPSNGQTKLSPVHMMASSCLDPVIDKIWRHAYNDSLVHSENFEQEDLSTRFNKASVNMTEERDATSRSRWHRVEVQLTASEEMHLSKDGYHGKKYKSNEFSEVRRAAQQKSFSLQSPTDDISAAISLIPEATETENPYFKRLVPLISQAETLSGNSSECTNVLKELFDTDIVTSLCIISAIGQELSISLKQHVNQKTWIMKRLIDFDVELLISPTNSESHIFFLVRYRGKVLNQGAFRGVVHHDGWWYTDLLSINSSRLDNFIKAPCTYVNVLLHFRISVCRMAKGDLSSISPDQYAERMAMLTTMISLEDKAQTEDMALNIRYMIMQFIKGDDELSWPNLGPVVGKMPTILRSRLAVYLHKQIKNYCELQWAALPKKLPVDTSDPDHSPDQFQDLLCPFTHLELHTFYDVVQVMYIAYSKNKNSTPEQNCDFAMIEKIAAYVLNVDERKTPIYKGLQDPPLGEFPKSHEFSQSFLKQACQLLKMRFKTQLGDEWQASTENQIIKELIRSTHHEAVATMKASADFDQAGSRMFEKLERLEEEGFQKLNSTQVNAANILLNLHRTVGYNQLTEEQWDEFRSILSVSNLTKKGVNAKGRFGRIVKSCKCHEAVIRELSTDPELQPLLISDYASIFKAVMEETKGVCCYLFKKQQHGGLREIYVLTFKSRLLQLLPEVCARVLCSLCPEEVLTHPMKKTHGYEQHNINVMKLGGQVHSDTVLHRTSSEDKSKWSQGMNVTAFALILTELLPEYLAKACIRVFHAFRNKRVLLPEGVVRMFMKDVVLENETYQKLKDQFWGKDRSQLFETVKGQLFLRTPTGMWQGILHYNSSLLHVLQSVHYKNMSKLFFNDVNKSILQRDGIGIGSLVLDTVVSSDDSATYGTVALPVGYTAATARVADEVLDIIMKLSTTHSRFFMMIESPKSSLSSRTVGEFNSIFVCSKTYISPAVKKVLAAVCVQEAEDLESRQVTASNMCKDILEEGCSFFQVQLHHVCQFVMHYMAFGLFVNPLFPMWSAELVKNPDPHLGFMLMDVEEVSGLLGYNFAKYNSLKGTSVAIMPTSSALTKSGTDGRFSTGVVVTQGDRRRWEQFKSRVVWQGWKDYIENNPSTLYMEKGLTRDEIQARLSAKACSKGIHESLKMSTSDSRALAASVYILDHPVVTVRSLNSVGDVKKEITPMHEKSTLIALTKAGNPGQHTSHKEMTPELCDVLYPNHRFYEVCREMIQESRGSILLPTVRHRKTRVKVEVRIGTSALVLPIMAVLRWKWLTSDQRHALFTLEESWKFYRRIFPWLHDTIEESLAASPFLTHIEMHSFLSTIEKKSSRVAILCKRINSDNPVEQIHELLKYNHYPELIRMKPPGITLDPEAPQTIPKHALHRLSLVSGSIVMALHSPATGEVSDLLEDMTSSVTLSDEELVHLSLSQKYARQVALYAVATSRPANILERVLLNSGRGIIKQYIKPQAKGKSGWIGPGRLLMHTKYCSLEVLVVDEFVVAIKCSSMDGLTRDYAVISEHLVNDGFTFNLDRTVKDYSAQHFPDVSERVITEWVATRRGLTRTTMPRPTIDRRTGIIKAAKKVATTEVFNPVIIVEPAITTALMAENLTITKGHKNDCPYLQIEGVARGCERSLPLLRYYGPKRPQPSHNLDLLTEREIDTESALDCWMVNKPIDSVAGIKLLKFSIGEGLGEDEGHIIERTNPDVLKEFVKRSFKWRAMSTYRVKSSILHYSSELSGADSCPPIVTRTMKEDVNRMMLQFLEDLAPHEVPELGGEPALPAAPEVLEPFDWAEEVERAISRDFSEDLQAAEPTDLTSRDDDSDEPVTVQTEQIEAPLVDLQLAPGLYMVHKLWDNVIKRLEARGVWDALNKNFRLSTRNQALLEMVCKVLSVHLDPQESDDEDCESD